MAILRVLFSLQMLLLLATLAGGGPAWAKKSGLTPAKVKQITLARKSFEACRKEAIAQLKSGKVSKKKFELALFACKENFPGADLYITCKKQAIQTANAKSLAPDQSVAQCKRYLTATTFDPEAPQPFFAEAGQLYFASIGLNRSLPTTALHPPNFNCEKLQKTAAVPTDAQYILFGNHPNTFAGMTDLQGSELAKLLKVKRPKEAGADAPGFGRVFGDLRGDDAVAYFPAAACDFDAAPGDLLAGLSAYYLLDQGGSSVTPYFGIAYYKQEQRYITTTKVINAMIRTLGPSYKSIVKNDTVSFIAAADLAETDDEQDPKNLCRQPRQHRFIGIVQSQKDQAKYPQYAILANVKNLCDFGDRLAKRLVQ